MTSHRSDAIDYTTQCTVIITYINGDRQDKVVYERPQPNVPDGPLGAFDRIRVSQFPTDEDLTTEALRIFADMKLNGHIAEGASIRSVFIARTAAAALEMGL